jgi:hypothetical protein
VSMFRALGIRLNTGQPKRWPVLAGTGLRRLRAVPLIWVFW